MSDCSCVYVDTGDGCASFYNTAMPKARKTHSCGECGREINIGETYESTTGLWEHGFETVKTCIDCLSVRKAFFCDGYNYSEVFNDLNEHIQDVSGEVSSDCMKNLTKRGRDMVCDLIEEYWEEWWDEEDN